jgi:hypothetical protein
MLDMLEVGLQVNKEKVTLLFQELALFAQTLDHIPYFIHLFHQSLFRIVILVSLLLQLRRNLQAVFNLFLDR